MKKLNLTDLFVDELKDVYSAEHQIADALPHLIEAAFSNDLKRGLAHHMQETKQQVKRLEEIFSLLGLAASEIPCGTMEGIILEADELVKHEKPSPALDEAIIGIAQKVEHYEIASYGTLQHFAKELRLPRQVYNLLTDTLLEEEMADKTLAKIANGSFFIHSIPREAAVSVI